MKPRRRRQVSDTERKRLAEMGRTNLKRYREVNVEAPENGLESLRSNQDDLEVA